MRRMKVSELARTYGVSETTIRRWRDRGLVHFDELNTADPREPSETTGRPLPEGLGDPLPSGTESHQEASRRKVIAEANIKETQLAELRKDLVRMKTVKEIGHQLVVAARQRLLGIPSKVATDLAIEDKPNVIRETLETQIREALSELNNQPFQLKQ